MDDGFAYMAPVGSYPAGASPYGALDMAGNVWEWVADWHQIGYYAQSLYDNPTGPLGGDRKGLRGGSYINAFDGLRVVARASHKPDGSFDVVGFRCAMDAP